MKMKKFKITKSIILTIIISLQLMIIVSANGPLDDPPPTVGSIILHKYDMETLVGYNTPGDGTELEDDTDMGNGKKLNELNPLQNIPFTLTRVELKLGADKGSNDVDDYEPMSGSEGKIDHQSTDYNGIIVWDNLPFGYYLIVEDDNELSDTTVAPFIVQIPLTNPEGNGFLYNVHVYPKNLSTGPNIDKEVVEPETDTGSNVVKWRIAVDIPSDIKDAMKFTITDELDYRLTYVDNSVVAYYLDHGDNKISFDEVFYTVDYDGIANIIVISLDANGFTELGIILESHNPKDEKLYFEFETLARAETEGDLGEIVNDADLNYTNSHNLDHKTKSPPTPPSVYLYSIEIDKHDAAGEPLEGAIFKIYPTEDDAIAKTNAIKDPDNPMDDWQIISDYDGYGEFLGLPAGTYWLVEIQTPPGGYNLLPEPIKAIIEDRQTEPYSFVFEVVNNKGFLLPTTGGTGTMLFTICGIVLIGMATVVLGISIFIGGKRKKRNRIIRREYL